MPTLIDTKSNPVNKKEHRKKKSNDSQIYTLPPLELNDKVRLHDGKSWSVKGKIVEVCKEPRSYMVFKKMVNNSDVIATISYVAKEIVLRRFYSFVSF